MADSTWPVVPEIEWTEAIEMFLGTSIDGSPRIIDLGSFSEDGAATQGDIDRAIASEDPVKPWKFEQLPRLSLYCDALNQVRIPYAALLAMSHDINVLRDLLKTKMPVETMTTLPLESDPVFLAYIKNFKDKLIGLQLTTVPIDKRLLLTYLRFLTRPVSVPPLDQTEYDARTFCATNLGSIVHIVCTSKGIADFRINADLIQDVNYRQAPALFAIDPAYCLTRADNPLLHHIVESLDIFFPVMQTKMLETPGISFEHIWNFSELQPSTSPDLPGMTGGGARRRAPGGKKAAAKPRSAARAASPPRQKKKKPQPLPVPKHRRSRS